MSSDQAGECTITLEDGTHYDLSSLASAKADYQTTGGNSTFNLNVCRGVVGEVWNVDNPETVGGYFNKEAGDFSLGRVNSTLHISPATNEPMIYLQNGSPCPTNPQEYASTVIRFICSPTTFEAGTPKLIAALPPLDTDQSCHFVFEWSTHVACATNPKAKLEQGHFIAFFAFVLIAILTWFGGHTLYNRYYLKRRGMDQFPVPSVSAPKLPKLGRGDNSGPKPWSFGRRSQRGYSGLRSDEHAQENESFAGRFSLDDDEDEDLTGTGAEDARALGGETDAWRGQRSNGTEGQSKVGVHQGLVDV